MKNISLLLLGLLFAINTASLQAAGFTLTSPDIAGQLTKAQLYAGFGCNGDNISPRLKWNNVPKGTKSFAITLYDPDAPTGSGWWHWLIFNIPANIRELKEGAGNLEFKRAPKGSVQSITSFGKNGFGGACPPIGDGPHQYIFTIFALKVAKVNLIANATPALVGFNLRANTLARASIVAYYERK